MFRSCIGISSLILVVSFIIKSYATYQDYQHMAHHASLDTMISMYAAIFLVPALICFLFYIFLKHNSK